MTAEDIEFARELLGVLRREADRYSEQETHVMRLRFEDREYNVSSARCCELGVVSYQMLGARSLCYARADLLKAGAIVERASVVL